MDYETLGDRIRALRVKRGLTQQVAATHAEMAMNTWAAIERGDGSPSLKTLSKIAGVCGTTLSALLKGLEVAG